MTHFFQANDIDNAGKKRTVLLSVVGPVTYKLLRNLLASAKPGEKTYDELVRTLSAHYGPPPSEIIPRFKFHSHFCNPGESVATYVAELRSLAEFCNFGQTLEAMLRDHIVCGINDDAIQRHLLAGDVHTYAQIYVIRTSTYVYACSGRTKDQKLVGRLLKIGYFIGY